LSDLIVLSVHSAADDGHYRLQYDLPGSWSQKYNLLFQPILNISTSELFPASVFETEDAWYMQQLQAYGVPLVRVCFSFMRWYVTNSPRSPHRYRTIAANWPSSIGRVGLQRCRPTPTTNR
jgi:hypothetical protein